MVLPSGKQKKNCVVVLTTCMALFTCHLLGIDCEHCRLLRRSIVQHYNTQSKVLGQSVLNLLGMNTCWQNVACANTTESTVTTQSDYTVYIYETLPFSPGITSNYICCILASFFHHPDIDLVVTKQMAMQTFCWPVDHTRLT